MMMKIKKQYYRQQKGAVLVVAMVFLLIITLFAIGSMRGSNLNLLMASNEQARIEAAEKTQALIDNILSIDDNIKVAGSVGYTMCAVGASCDSATLQVESTFTTVASGESVNYTVVRKGPELGSVPALNEEDVSSASSYKAAVFEVTATYDGSANRQGRSNIAQGVMVIIPGS